MCFELDSSPPIPVIRGAAVSHEDLVLEARDGNRFAAFMAPPGRADRHRHRGAAGRPRALPLLRGARAALRRARVHSDRVRLLRPDRGRRQAGRGLRLHGARAQTTSEGVQADLAAVVAKLRETCSVIFTVGFCFGGRHSWLAAAERPRPPRRDRVLRAPRHGPGRHAGCDERASEIAAPILGLMGGDDR